MTLNLKLTSHSLTECLSSILLASPEWRERDRFYMIENDKLIYYFTIRYVLYTLLKCRPNNSL